MASDWLKNWETLKIFFFRSIGWNHWNETKYSPNTPLVVPFQNFVCWPCQLSKMAATADYAALVCVHYLAIMVLGWSYFCMGLSIKDGVYINSLNDV